MPRRNSRLISEAMKIARSNARRARFLANCCRRSFGGERLYRPCFQPTPPSLFSIRWQMIPLSRLHGVQPTKERLAEPRRCKRARRLLRKPSQSGLLVP
jgi:hypothetical protein